MALRNSYAEPPRWCPRQDSNLQPLPCEESTLSVELRGHQRKVFTFDKRDFLKRYSVDNYLHPLWCATLRRPCEGSKINISWVKNKSPANHCGAFALSRAPDAFFVQLSKLYLGSTRQQHQEGSLSQMEWLAPAILLVLFKHFYWLRRVIFAPSTPGTCAAQRPHHQQRLKEQTH